MDYSFVYSAVMHLKDDHGMINSVDPGQMVNPF